MVLPNKYTPLKDSYLGQMAFVLDILLRKRKKEEKHENILKKLRESIHPQFSELKLSMILFILYKLDKIIIDSDKEIIIRIKQ